MAMLEKQIKQVMNKKNIQPIEIYSALWVSKQNFYKAIKSENLGNRTLKRILDYLGLEVLITLVEKNDKS